MADPSDFEFAPARYEEALFARGEDDVLIRKEKATLPQLAEEVKVVIDGRPVTVFKAKPLTDELGNVLRDANGKRIPRATTIYDAAATLWAGEELQKHIPVLCHRDHLPDPV